MPTESAACMGCLVNPNWAANFAKIPTYIHEANARIDSVFRLKENGLTLEEKHVLQNLVTAWNSYVAIETKESNLTEFLDSIHRCQQLIALRVARRVNPEVWFDGSQVK